MTDNNIRYENPAEGVARIMLARPDKHNAINPQMIYDVNAAFDRAVRDESVKVIILGADGRNFSAGHDIADTVADFQAATKANSPSVSTVTGKVSNTKNGLTKVLSMASTAAASSDQP